ncbi:MAG: SDR family NAD(P)-dependent oxidoreductase [Verrucomicrobiota bacterium]
MPTPSEYINRVSVIIVTGGSSGIGCSLIKACLNLSSDVVVCNLSRSKPKDFLSKKGVHLPTDLARPSELAASAAKLELILSEAPEGEVLLINNSGFGDYGPFQDLKGAKQLEMIDLNIRAVVDLTVRLLPIIGKRGGAIVNVASTAGFQPTPYLATYGATKAFVLNWSLALNEDLRGSGVRALAVCPGPTRSNFFKSAGFERPPMEGGWINRLMDMSADQVADLTFWAIAREKALVVTGWQNCGLVFFSSKFPKVLITRISGAILRRIRTS